MTDDRTPEEKLTQAQAHLLAPPEALPQPDINRSVAVISVMPQERKPK